MWALQNLSVLALPSDLLEALLICPRVLLCTSSSCRQLLCGAWCRAWSTMGLLSISCLALRCQTGLVYPSLGVCIGGSSFSSAPCASLLNNIVKEEGSYNQYYIYFNLHFIVITLNHTLNSKENKKSKVIWLISLFFWMPRPIWLLMNRVSPSIGQVGSPRARDKGI